jgi:hypothetical protein
VTPTGTNFLRDQIEAPLALFPLAVPILALTAVALLPLLPVVAVGRRARRALGRTSAERAPTLARRGA